MCECLFVCVGARVCVHGSQKNQCSPEKRACLSLSFLCTSFSLAVINCVRCLDTGFRCSAWMNFLTMDSVS